jgi:hypothetical protein
MGSSGGTVVLADDLVNMNAELSEE